MKARLYCPARSAMQSGGGWCGWLLEFPRSEPPQSDPLTGWTGGGNTLEQVQMRFKSREAAFDFAQKHGYSIEIMQPELRRSPVMRNQGYGHAAPERAEREKHP